MSRSRTRCPCGGWFWRDDDGWSPYERWVCALCGRSAWVLEARAREQRADWQRIKGASAAVRLHRGPLSRAEKVAEEERLEQLLG